MTARIASSFITLMVVVGTSTTVSAQVRAVGERCYRNSDCPLGHSCFGGVCKEECAEDRDCPKASVCKKVLASPGMLLGKCVAPPLPTVGNVVVRIENEVGAPQTGCLGRLAGRTAICNKQTGELIFENVAAGRHLLFASVVDLGRRKTSSRHLTVFVTAGQTVHLSVTLRLGK